MSESFLSRWGRRGLTIPLTLLATAAATALLPLLLLASLLVDLAGRRRLGVSRGALMVLVFLWCETVGLGAALVIWLFAWPFPRAFRDANARLQALWGMALYSAGQRLLGVEVRIDGRAPAPGQRPLLVLVRHASTIDTVLPVVALSYPLGWHLRYVLKRELLVDPCLDVVGQRLPNRFVRRGGDHTAAEVGAVLGLYQDLGPRDAVVIFPEGTRFTPARRQRLLERMQARLAEPGTAAGTAAELALATELQQTLSPLRAGALALLAENPGADLLVIAHAGFEAATTMAGFLAGATVGARARVRLIHRRFEELPRDPDGQARLLADLWRQVDQFARGQEPAA